MTKAQRQHFWDEGNTDETMNEILREAAETEFNKMLTKGKVKETDRQEAIEAYTDGFCGNKLN